MLMSKYDPDEVSKEKQLTQKKQKIIAYPYQAQRIQRELNEVQNEILKIIIQIKQKRMSIIANKNQSIPLQVMIPETKDNTLREMLKKEDEVDIMYAENVRKCCQFYEQKLSKQQNRYVQMRNQSRERIANQQGEIIYLKQQLDILQKQAQDSKNKIKKLQTESEEVRNYRKSQKDRIVEMLIQQKQQIFCKYNQNQKQIMVVLEFINKVEDMLKKKSDETQQDLNRMSYIKEIQLEASNFYSALNSPLVQQILNAFTQVINTLNKKFEKMEKFQKREQPKAAKLQKNSKILRVVPVLTARSSLGKEKKSDKLEITHLKQQISKMESQFQEKIRQCQNNLNFEKQKGTSMKRKIQKLEEQLQKSGKQLQTLQLRYEDTIKKLKYLENTLLDNQRKYKMEMDSFDKRGFSSTQINFTEQQQQQTTNIRQKSKSLYTQRLNKESKNNAELQLENKNKQIEQLHKRLQQLSKSKQKNSHPTKDQKNKIEILQSKICIKDKQLETRQNQIVKKNQMLIEKGRIIQDIQISLTNKNNQMSQCFFIIKKLQGEIQEKDKLLQIWNDQAAKTAVQLYQLLSLIDQRNKKNQIKPQNLNLAEHNATYEEIRSMIDNLQLQIKSQYIEIDKKIGQMLQKERRSQILLNQKNDEIHNLNLRLKGKQKLNQQNQNMLKRIQDQLKQLQVKDNQSDQEIKQLKQCLIKVQMQKAEQTKKVKLLERQTANLRDQLELKQKKIATAQKMIPVSEMQRRLQEINYQYLKLNQTLMAKQSSLKQLQKIFRETSKTLKDTQALIAQMKNSEKANKQQNQKYKMESIRKIRELEQFVSDQNEKLGDLSNKLRQNQANLQQHQQNQKQLNSKIGELQDRISQMRAGQDSETDNDQNLNQSKQLNMMQQQILNFKEQLNSLLTIIKQKDDEIRRLNTCLKGQKDKQNLHSSQNQIQLEDVKSQESGTERERLVGIIKNQQNVIEMLNTQHIKQEILLSKIQDLQSILNKEKQIYQSQLAKNHDKIFQLQDQIRVLKEQSSAKKKRVLSEDYFSIQPISNNLSSKQKTVGNSQGSKKRTQLKQDKNSQDEIGSQVFHSLQQDFVQQAKNRRNLANELDKQIKCRLRRQKSQQCQRNKYGQLKIQKLSSIQRCYESDEKSKQQNKKKNKNAALVESKCSPSQAIVEKQRDVVKGFPSITSHQQIPQVTNSENSALNEIIKSLAQQNKNLKSLNEKYKRDLIQISQLMQIFNKNWKDQKSLQNCSQFGKLVSTQKLIQNVKLLEHNKPKLFQLNSSDMETIFDSITKLVHETKRWIDLIQRLATKNNKMALQMALLRRNPKLIKTKTSRVTGDVQEHYRRSRSVYSEGNVYKQRHIDVDESQYELHDQQQHHPIAQTNLNVPSNSLQILFKQNIQMSQISSVKHKSHNSGFLNSKSQIAKMFQKGQKHEKDHKDKDPKKQQHTKKDIVDEYALMNNKGQKFDKLKVSNLNINTSNNKIQHSRVNLNIVQNSPLMQKNSSNYIQEASNCETQFNKRLDQKSNKARRKMLQRQVKKTTSINSKIGQTKKQFGLIIKNIIQKYEERISHLQNKFSQAMKKLMNKSTLISVSNKNISENQLLTDQSKLILKANSEGSTVNKSVSGRISEKDQQIYQKIQELQSTIEKYKKQNENKEKMINDLKEQIKQIQKKLKEQKQLEENLKINCCNLKNQLDKKQLDFKKFIQKISKSPNLKTSVSSDASVQSEPSSQQQSPTLEGQKKFLKSKKFLAVSEILSTSQPIRNEAATNQEGQKNENNDKKVEIKSKSLSSIKVPDASSSSLFQKLINFTDEIKEKDDKEQKKEAKKDQLQVSIGRIRSQPVPNEKKKQEKQRQSGKSEAEKPLSMVEMINSILNPHTTLSKKKTISEASKPDQVFYYQIKMKDINQQLKQVLQNNFQINKAEDKKQLQNQDEIFKSKKERDTKIKNQNEGEKDKQKQVDKRKDEDEILDNIKTLEREVINFKNDSKRAKEEQQSRLIIILRKLISYHKISKKSIQKIINEIQKQDNNNAAKLINARIFFKSLYNDPKFLRDQKQTQNRQGTQIYEGRQSQFVRDTNQIVNADVGLEFQSFQQKYNQLNRQNDQLKTELQQKCKQIRLLKHEPPHQQPKKLNSRHQSFASNENDQQFEDFQNKQIFDNTKPTFEVMEALKLQLQFYKKKCAQFEISLNKKKSEKTKCIRKW